MHQADKWSPIQGNIGQCKRQYWHRVSQITVQKTIFSFSKCSEKMVFPKKLPWNMIFLVLSRKMIFLYYWKCDLILYTENEGWPFSKNYMEIWHFLQMFWKGGLSKKLHWNLIFLVLSGKMIFLFPENMILFFRRKMKDHLSQKKYMINHWLMQIIV